MARDESRLGSLDMAIATVRRQFYDSEARPLARRYHIRVARPSRAVNLFRQGQVPPPWASAPLRVMPQFKGSGVHGAHAKVRVRAYRARFIAFSALFRVGNYAQARPGLWAAWRPHAHNPRLPSRMAVGLFDPDRAAGSG